MKKKVNGVEKIEKTAFICQSVFFLFLALPFLIMFFACLGREFLAEDELIYEECTFVKYEFEEEEYGKGGVARYYYIYVKEYVYPLRVDNIVYDRVNERKLSGLKAGEKLVVSIDKEDWPYALYSVACECSDILSYEDYLEEHKENYKFILIGFPAMSCLGFGLLVANVIYYKKKGRCMPLR